MIKTIDEKTIFGKKIRTNNSDIPAIMKHWGDVSSMGLQGDVYAIYYNYESNHTGNYDFLIGAQTVNLPDAVQIEKGNYMEIKPYNQSPQGVGEAWQKIWSDASIEEQRTYQHDYECYFQDGEIRIYLSVK